MIKKGMFNEIFLLVLALIGFLVAVGIAMVLKEYISDTTEGIGTQIDENMYERTCVQLDTEDNNFQKNQLDEFNVPLRDDVNDILYFTLRFDKGWGALTGNGWYLEWWKVVCDGPAEEYELMRFSSKQWINDNMFFTMTENKGYYADLGCGKNVRVVTQTGNQWWAGTDGVAYLCYLCERSTEGEIGGSEIRKCSDHGGTCMVSSSCPSELPVMVPKVALLNCDADGNVCCKATAD